MRQSILYKTYVFLLLYLFSTSAICQVASLDFLDNFKEAKTKAETQGKHLLVYVHSDYCKDCSRIEQEVFLTEDVRTYFSKNHILVKLHFRKNGKKFVWKHKIKTYPTILFFDEKGKELHRIKGFKDQDELIRAAEISYRNPKEQKKKYEKQYSKLKNDPEFLLEYLSFAEDIGNNRLIDQLIDQIIKRKDSFEELVWMDLVMSNVYKENSKLFKILIEQKDSFYEVYGEEEVKKLLVEIMIYDELSKINTSHMDQLIIKTRKKINRYGLKVSKDVLQPSIVVCLDGFHMPYRDFDSGADLYLLMLHDYSAEVDEKYTVNMIRTILDFKEDESDLEIVDKVLDTLMAESSTKELERLKKKLEYKKSKK